MGTCHFKYYTFSSEICNMWLGFPRRFSWKQITLTFLPRMARLLWTSCAMRKREGSYGQLAEENQKCEHSPATVKQTKTNKQKNRKTRYKKISLAQHFGTYSPTCCAQSLRETVLRTVSVARVWSAPRKRPWERRGTNAAPQDSAYGRVGTCRRGRPPASRSNRTCTIPPLEPSRGAAHLPFWAHVPAAPGPKPCRRAAPAAARPSVSALPKSPQRSGPRSPQGWGDPALGPWKCLGSAEGRPGQPRDARDASSCLVPGGRGTTD